MKKDWSMLLTLAETVVFFASAILALKYVQKDNFDLAIVFGGIAGALFLHIMK